nr:NAD(P)H-dependent oxidoreductase [Nostoc sp. WHI]
MTHLKIRKISVSDRTKMVITEVLTPPEALTPEMAELLKFSDELVDEFLAAEQCVFSVPMYNFSIPSNFKGYIDQVVRVGRTFTEEDSQVKGLANGKKVLFITSRGVEYGAGSPYEGWDCQEPALRYAERWQGEHRRHRRTFWCSECILSCHGCDSIPSTILDSILNP